MYVYIYMYIYIYVDIYMDTCVHNIDRNNQYLLHQMFKI